MSTKNSKLASQALKEMQEINEATKAIGKETIKSLLSEAVKDALREAVEEDDDVVVQDDEMNDTEEAPVEQPADAQATETPEVGGEGETEEPAADAAEGEGEDSWDNYEQYKVGDDTYDLSGEEDYENVVKVYKLLKDDDQVIVKKDGDKIEIKDNETDAEYVISLGTEEEEGAEGAEVEPAEGETVEEPEAEETPAAEAAETEEVPDEGGEEEEEKLQENKKQKKTMKESKEVLFEIDLGYTDNYQDKDPIDGLSNNEPSKSGRSWHKGVPTGTEKPWAGDSESKGEPFEKTINEEDVEECGGGVVREDEIDENVTIADGRKKRKSHVPSHRDSAKVQHHTSKAGVYKPIEEVKKIEAENKALKEAVVELRKSLQETYMTTLNLGKITKLFLENTTTQEEKVGIINRFTNEAKTPEQSKALYESINASLKAAKPAPVVENKSMTAEGSKKLNENKDNRPKDLIETIDFMKRVMNY